MESAALPVDAITGSMRAPPHPPVPPFSTMTPLRLALRFSIGLALTTQLPGCAHEASPVARTWDRADRHYAAVRALEMIGAAEDYAHDAYVEPITREALRGACVAAWPAQLPRPTSAHRDALRAALDAMPIVDVRQARDECLRGMMRALDGRSRYAVAADRSADLKNRISPGLGLAPGTRGRIVSVVPGSPADAAGVLPGDRLVEIDGQPGTDRPEDELEARLRGAPGSRVTLGLLRGHDERRLDITIQRERFASVRVDETAPGVLLVSLAQLQEETARDFMRAFVEARQRQAGDLRGVVLDLRDNTGGLLSTVTDIASLLLPEGVPIIELRGRGSEPQIWKAELSRSLMYDRPRAISVQSQLRRVPIVVLVNEHSASGAEMIAAALQDHGRARVLGARSAGVGAIQTVRPLQADDGLHLILLTTARAHRSTGAPIAAGVLPDLVVDGTRPLRGSSARDPAVAAALEALAR